MTEDKKDPFLTVDIRIHFRGVVYRVHARDVLKWLVPLLVVAGRLIYRHYRTGAF